MLDNIIMNILSDTVEREMNSVINKYFSRIKDDGIYLYHESLKDYTQKITVTDTNKTLRSHHFMGEWGIFRYLGGLLSVMVDEQISRTEQRNGSMILVFLIINIQSKATI